MKSSPSRSHSTEAVWIPLGMLPPALSVPPLSCRSPWPQTAHSSMSLYFSHIRKYTLGVRVMSTALTSCRRDVEVNMGGVEGGVLPHHNINAYMCTYVCWHWHCSIRGLYVWAWIWKTYETSLCPYFTFRSVWPKHTPIFLYWVVTKASDVLTEETIGQLD